MVPTDFISIWNIFIFQKLCNWKKCSVISMAKFKFQISFNENGEHILFILCIETISHIFITKLIHRNSPLIVQLVDIFFDVPFVHFEVLYVQLATPTPTDLVQLTQVLNYHVQNMGNKSWLVYYSRSDSLPVGIWQHLNNYVYWHKMILWGW